MFVPCPHCGFLVALIVTGSDAPPRCPRCSESLDFPVAEPVTPAAQAGDSTHPTPAQARQQTAATPAGITAVEPGVRPLREATATRRQRPAPRQPSFLRTMATPARKDGSTYWSGVIAVSGLAALLGLQLLLAQRADLAASERWRPIISTVCTVLGCEVPLWHQPNAYTMLARDVQPALGRPGVLQVKASFRNDARWPQAWPALQLQLTDVNGQAVAARILQPADYHSGDEPPSPLAPGQSASVAFQVAEPATPIVAFTFDFR